MNNELLALINKKFQTAVAEKYGDAPLARLEETEEWIGPGINADPMPLILQHYDWMYSPQDVAEINGAILVHDYLQWVQDMKDGWPEMKPRKWRHCSVEVFPMEVSSGTLGTLDGLIWKSRDGFPLK